MPAASSSRQAAEAARARPLHSRGEGSERDGEVTAMPVIIAHATHAPHAPMHGQSRPLSSKPRRRQRRAAVGWLPAATMASLCLELELAIAMNTVLPPSPRPSPFSLSPALHPQAPASY